MADWVSTPDNPSGRSKYTSREKIADLRRASAVSRCVFWYSGAKVAAASTPYEDHPAMYIQAKKSFQAWNDPTPPVKSPKVRKLPCQWPVKYGRMQKRNSGIMSRDPFTYPT